MPSAPLRLVYSREPGTAVTVDFAPDGRPAPETAAAADGPFRVSALASFGLHAAILAGMLAGAILGEERAAGTGEDVILIESVPVEFIESAPMPEAPPVEVAEAEPTAEAEQPVPEEPVEEVAEPVETPNEPVEEPAEPPEDVPEPVLDPPEDVAELPPESTETETLPELEPPAEISPLPDADAGELPAAPEEADAEAPDPETVPTPRVKPERTEVAAAEPPPEPRETKPAPKAPAAPPPSTPAAPSAPSAKSGGRGGGGSAQAGGTAAASAYRAKVAAQLKRKRFYPNAARRDRLTGTATVSFTLNASGRVTSVRIVRSSGARVLDDAAREMVRRAAPYPPIPAGLGSTITIQAPIAFDLPR